MPITGLVRGPAFGFFLLLVCCDLEEGLSQVIKLLQSEETRWLQVVVLWLYRDTFDESSLNGVERDCKLVPERPEGWVFRTYSEG